MEKLRLENTLKRVEGAQQTLNEKSAAFIEYSNMRCVSALAAVVQINSLRQAAAEKVAAKAWVAAAAVEIAKMRVQEKAAAGTLSEESGRMERAKDVAADTSAIVAFPDLQGFSASAAASEEKPGRLVTTPGSDWWVN